MLRGFLIKLTALDGQLEDIKRQSSPILTHLLGELNDGRRSYIRNHRRDER